MTDSVVSWKNEESTRRRSEWTRSREKEAGSISSISKTSLREKNKRLRAIYEDEGLEYGKDATEETIVNRYTVARNLRSKQVTEVFRLIRRSRNVELCFLVDATGSMQSHIDGVRMAIQRIVKHLTTSKDGKQGNGEVDELKLSFVAYRDHGDTNQYEILSFTNSTSDFQSFLSKIKASGGGDECEDVFGGIRKTLDLSWSDNAGTKVVFHICDAPCHGKDFHSGRGDSYPAGDPKGLSHTSLFAELRSKSIFYHFGKINNSTDLMVKKFSEVYGDAILDFDINKVEDILNSVVSAVIFSVSSTITTSKASGGVFRPEKKFAFVKSDPDWIRCPVYKGRFVTYDFPDSIQDIVDDIPLGRRQPKSAEVKIAPNPFAKGAERVAFYGKDVSTYVEGKKGNDKDSLEVKRKDENIVLKEYLHHGEDSAKRYEMFNQMQTIASFFAQQFTSELNKKIGEKKIIKFVKIKTVHVASEKGDRFMSTERRFACTDKFIRFSNNTDYALLEEKAMEYGITTDFIHLVMAFSHWTYKASNRYLMVVDLEGIVSKEIGSGKTAVLMTDPAIHCSDLTRFGKMNHGEKGMSSFFRQHICNHFCKTLGINGFLPTSDHY